MSCRSTPAGSALTTYARLTVTPQLSDVATLSIFHELRRTATLGLAGGSLIARTDGAYRDLLALHIESITSSRCTLTPARQASLLARLRRAQTEPIPDQPTVHALFALLGTVRAHAVTLERYADRLADTLGATRAEILTEFNTAAGSIDRSRSAGNPASYTPENLAAARTAHLGTEAGTVHAVAHFATRIARHSADRALTLMPRIVRIVYANPGTYGHLQLLEAGHDPRNNRTEVVLRNVLSGVTSTHAYQGQSAAAFAADFTDNAGDGARAAAAWADNLRSNPAYAYGNQTEADLASAAPRCATCGQFANTLHSCPPLGEVRRMAPHLTNSAWTRQNVSINVPGPDGGVGAETPDRIALPAVRELRTAFAAGPVEIHIRQYGASVLPRTPETPFGRYEHYALEGAVTVYRDTEGAVAYNVAELSCSCAAYRANQTCAHTLATVTAIDARVNPPTTARQTTEQRAAAVAAAQAAAEEAAASDWTKDAAAFAEAAATWRANTEVSYSADPAAFERDYNAAIEARAVNNDQPVIPYMRENVLGGYAQRGSRQAFGMEIEYEFPRGMDRRSRNAANVRIGRALHAAGLARVDYQERYHAGKRYGFRDTHLTADGHSTWSWERDASVNGGELVTPGLYDEPETWDKIETAVRILRENGAVATTKAGAHVHVGTGMYNDDPQKYAELARLMIHHEDVMHRLAADPVRGTIRNNEYAQPLNAVPAEGFTNTTDLDRWQGGRHKALNLDGVDSCQPAKSHPEFRLFDSTLNPGTMQAQIKLSVALVHAAARIADRSPTGRRREPLGAHTERAKARGRIRRPLTSTELADDSATFRSLMDTLFTRAADKAQMTALFAQTKWSARRR